MTWQEFLDCEIEYDGRKGEIVSVTHGMFQPPIFGVSWEDGTYSTISVQESFQLRHK